MKKEKRNLSFKNIEVRTENNNGKRTIEGIIPYNSKSVEMWGTIEIIDKTAFNKTLKDKSEVRALFNHDDSKVLGNTLSETLILENTENGLICRCDLPNTSYANDLYEVMDRGDVKTMSFGFTPIKWIEDEKGKLRTLKECQLHEVSFGVTFPAFPKTNSQILRGLEKNNINIERLNEALDKNTFDDNDKNTIKQTVNLLNNLLNNNEAIETEPNNNTLETVNTSNIKEDTTALELQIETELMI